MMVTMSFPTLDLKATGANIAALRKAKGYSVLRPAGILRL